MINSQQLTQLGVSLAKLGTRRLMLLGVVGVAVVMVVGIAAYYLGRPAMQPIYTGLSSQDVTRITAALAEAGVTFDVNEQRNAVMVPFGQTARARTLLAQKGLPTSARAGYELFDQLGSIGLTSFMQEITRVRALEGEIARTIQALDGVGAARVHLVLSEAGSFRRERRDATASVLLRVEEKWSGASGQVVRHIVAAAVPGMKLEQVSVASTDGRMLVTGGDEQSLGSNKLAEMEKSMAADLEQRAGRTLASTLGAGNYQISATVRLDVDRQQVNETIFDPKSRIERSVRVVKQSGSTEEGGVKAAAGVEANVPKEEANSTDGDKRRQREDRKEELTNYELNSKTVQTVREGYRVQRLAIAVVVSRKHLADSIGPNPDAAAIAARMAEIKRLISAATGANPERDDRVEITTVDFAAQASALAPVSGPSMMDYLIMNTGTGINALAMVLIAVVVIWFGVKPITRVLAEQAALGAPAVAAGVLGSSLAKELPSRTADTPMSLGGPASDEAVKTVAAPAARRVPHSAARDRLAAIVDSDDVEVTRVLKSWMQEAKES
jgi:flagellar M-ring protein FliF